MTMTKSKLEIMCHEFNAVLGPVIPCKTYSLRNSVVIHAEISVVFQYRCCVQEETNCAEQEAGLHASPFATLSPDPKKQMTYHAWNCLRVQLSAWELENQPLHQRHSDQVLNQAHYPFRFSQKHPAARLLCKYQKQLQESIKRHLLTFPCAKGTYFNMVNGL